MFVEEPWHGTVLWWIITSPSRRSSSPGQPCALSPEVNSPKIELQIFFFQEPFSFGSFPTAAAASHARGFCHSRPGGNACHVPPVCCTILQEPLKPGPWTPQHWLCWGKFSLSYPAGQENKLLNLLWAHLQDSVVPASPAGNPNHRPAPAKTRLKHFPVCTEGKSLSSGLSHWLQMFQMSVCFIWGQPPEPQHSQETAPPTEGE